MNIQIEYQKLKELSETPAGWKMIEDAWCEANGETKIEGSWVAQRQSKGTKVEGFAIDSKSKRILLGTYTHHAWAYDTLCSEIMRDENIPAAKAELRIKKGWSGNILDFEFPCILMTGVVTASIFHGDESELLTLTELEESILLQGTGLPLNRIFLDHMIKNIRRTS